MLLSCLFSSVEYSFSVCQERSPNGKAAPTKRSGDFSVPLLRKRSFVVTELTIRDVEHRAAVDLRPVGVVRKKTNSARSTKCRINHGHTTRLTIIFSRVIH